MRLGSISKGLEILIVWTAEDAVGRWFFSSNWDSVACVEILSNDQTFDSSLDEHLQQINVCIFCSSAGLRSLHCLWVRNIRTTILQGDTISQG